MLLFTVMNEQTDTEDLCSAILFQNSNTNVTANNNTDLRIWKKDSRSSRSVIVPIAL